jgi:hypothetical protein
LFFGQIGHFLSTLCHGPRLRATQVTQASFAGIVLHCSSRKKSLTNWVARICGP